MLKMESISKETHAPLADEQENVILNDNNILLGNIATQEYFYVPLTEEIRSEFGITTLISNGREENDELNSKLWNRENTLFLIDTYKRFEKEFASGMKKNVWEKVALACKHLSKNINAKQCETKWKTLKRSYSNIKSHNSTSGKEKKYWEFYDLLHEILFKKPEIEARATCSSIFGLHIQGKTNSEVPKKIEEENKADESENTQFESSFLKKRKLRISDTERRHKDKMQRLDTFNEIFAKMVEKMPENKPQIVEQETNANKD